MKKYLFLLLAIVLIIGISCKKVEEIVKMDETIISSGDTSKVKKENAAKSGSLWTNLIGYYNLEESSDSVHTQEGSFNGTAYGNPARQQSGKKNYCYSFDGTSAIDLGHTAYRFTTDFTISMWFKTSSSAGGILFSRYWSLTGYRCYASSINASGQIAIGVYNPSNVYTSIISPVNTISTGQWYHVVFVKSGTSMKIILNNTVVASTNSAPITIKDQQGEGNLSTFIGACAKSNTIPDGFFNGSIDEVALWDIGLTDEQISSLWNDGQGDYYPCQPPSNLTAEALDNLSIKLTWIYNIDGADGFVIFRSTDGMFFSQIGPDKISPYNSSFVDAEINEGTLYYYKIATIFLGYRSSFSNIVTATGYRLIGYYNLEESSGSVLTQEGSFNGTAYGIPARQQSGKNNYCYSFDGSSAVDLGDNACRFTNDFTISMWFKTTSSAGGILFSRYFSSYGYRCYASSINASGQIAFGVYNPSNVNTSIISPVNTISANQWYHVAFVKSGTTMKIILNNSVVASTNSAPATIRDQAGSGTNLKTFIGACAKSNTKPDGFFNGSIDEVALWNIGLTDEQIATLWNNGNGNFYPINF